MIYLTQFLGIPVLDWRERTVGTLEDFIFHVQQPETCPQAVELVVRRGEKLRQANWAEVQSLTLVQAVLSLGWRKLLRGEMDPNGGFYGREALNQPVVDERGSPIGTATDLGLRREGQSLLVGHVEVVGQTFWHRLGLMRIRHTLVPRLREVGQRSLVPWLEAHWHANQAAFQVESERLVHLHPAEVADILRKLPVYLRRDFLFSLDGEEASELFGAFEPEIRQELEN